MTASLIWFEALLSRVSSKISYIESDILGLPCWLRWISHIDDPSRRSMDAVLILAIAYYALIAFSLIGFITGTYRTLSIAEIYLQSAWKALWTGCLMWVGFVVVSSLIFAVHNAELKMHSIGP